MANIRYCPRCGYIDFLATFENKGCDYCNRDFINTKYTFSDYAKTEMKEADFVKIIEEEYIIGNPEFSEEIRQARIEKERYDGIHGQSGSSSSTVKCPYCKSTNVYKISTASRAVSVGLFGLASRKIGKQWHCNKCKSDF